MIRSFMLPGRPKVDDRHVDLVFFASWKAQSGRQSRGLGLFCFLEGPKWTTVTVIRSFLLLGRPKVDDSHGD